MEFKKGYESHMRLQQEMFRSARARSWLFGAVSGGLRPVLRFWESGLTALLTSCLLVLSASPTFCLPLSYLLVPHSSSFSLLFLHAAFSARTHFGGKCLTLNHSNLGTQRDSLWLLKSSPKFEPPNLPKKVQLGFRNGWNQGLKICWQPHLCFPL